MNGNLNKIDDLIELSGVFFCICIIHLPFCGPAYAITKAVPSRAANTIAVTQRARFCEQTATPFRVCRPPLLSPPVK